MNAQYHGGQDNNLQINFIKDFSVTTNFIGSNQDAIHKLYNDNNNIEHYPPQSYQPYIDNLKKFLFKNKIESNIHYPIPIHKQKIFKYKNPVLIKTEKQSREILSLPINQYLDERDIKRVCNCIKNFFDI